MSHRQRREHAVFNRLLQMVPGLEERLLNSEASEATEIAELVLHPSASMRLRCL